MGLALAQSVPAVQTSSRGATAASADIELVERLLAARREYETALEALRMQYHAIGDVERERWAQEELFQFNRIVKQAYRLELDVPPPTLQATVNIPAANELYRQAMVYKDKWSPFRSEENMDNQRRAEVLLQQLLTAYPQSDRIGDSAYQLGDIYERSFKQYRRAATYFERCFQWNPNTRLDARLRAARLYDKQLQERAHALELYKDVTITETDTKRMDEAKARIAELSTAKR
jgi:tetratricopeptide (TPR) repeat protein